MVYFSEHSSALKIQEGSSDVPNRGLRRGQVGALFAVGAHFIERREPAIISLPTGYGKTALMTAVGFVLKASRVLVITPTAALRSQALRAFSEMEALRRLGCLPPVDDLPNPNVTAVEGRLTSTEEWENLRRFDVVVCTPQSASPQIEGVQTPPADLFDVVVMDEGHHSPAATWSAMIDAFPDARHLLFSATAFRRDRRPLPGKMAFSYPLRKAVEERAFGRVTLEAVEVDSDSVTEARDKALITRAAEIFERDRRNGLDHRIFARTDRTKAAEDLAARYVAAGLRMKAVSSKKSKAQIELTLGELAAGEIDGIVCVDMLGEGYDFPRFKIAVLHAAHNSLVPTLQFIGRFARTNDHRTGDATFIAIPREVNAESEILYKAGVDWDVLLADIAEAKQNLALRDRAVLEAFTAAALPAGDYENVSAGAIRLGQHVAAYKVQHRPDFSSPPQDLGGLVVRAAWSSNDGSTGLILASEVKPPSWYTDEHLIDARHECFLLRHFDEEGLLFICSTDRATFVYDDLLTHFVDGDAKELPYQKVMRVRNGLTDQEYYNVGVRSISPTTTAESYRIMAGPSADRGIRQSDSSNFAQSHFMGRGKLDGRTEVVGASARGRMWAPGRNSIPGTLAWMASLHRRITSPQVALGRSGLDLLICGETLDAIPFTTCMADWDASTYMEPSSLRFLRNGEIVHSAEILDLEFTNFVVSVDAKTLSFEIGDQIAGVSIHFKVDEVPQFRCPRPLYETQVVQAEGEVLSLEQWLQEHPPRFFTKELNFFQHSTIYKRIASVEVSPASLQAMEWGDCEIEVEFDSQDPARQTVQRFVQGHLEAQDNNSFLIYDHRSGEAADFIVAKESNGRLVVRLYHCKGSGGAAPSGERVDDVYELAGQSVKSSRFQIKDSLVKHIRRRTTPKLGRGHSPFIIGDQATALDLVARYAPIDIRLEIFAVQPGLSAGALSDNVRQVIAAANDSCSAQNVSLTWLVSA